MNTPVRILIVEDTEEQASLFLGELRRGGYQPSARRIPHPEAVGPALDNDKWDVILVDYSMPDFKAVRVLKEVRARRLDTPVILASENLGDDVAVAALRAGAQDYFMKRDLHRLNPAVERALRENQERRARHQAEDALDQSEERFRELLKGLPLLAVFLDINGRVTFCNDHLLNVLGYARDEVVGQNWFQMFVPREERDDLEEAFFDKIGAGAIVARERSTVVGLNGQRRTVVWARAVLRDPNGLVMGTASLGVDVPAAATPADQQRMDDLVSRAASLASLLETSAQA